jgi:hypothetical protein
MEAKNFDLKDFTRIEVGGAFEVNISQSDSYQVNVSADDFPHVRVEKINDTLILKRQGIEWFAPFHGQPMAVITLPALTGLNVSGASHGKFENFQSNNNLTIMISGASHFEARNISVENLSVKIAGASGLIGDIKAAGETNLEISGASKVELTGGGTSVIAKVSGASKTDISKYPVQNANLEISGASSGTINVNGKLDADVSGASKLLWLGTPIMGDIRTSGASQLSRK